MSRILAALLVLFMLVPNGLADAMTDEAPAQIEISMDAAEAKIAVEAPEGPEYIGDEVFDEVIVEEDETFEEAAVIVDEGLPEAFDSEAPDLAGAMDAEAAELSTDEGVADAPVEIGEVMLDDAVEPLDPVDVPEVCEAGIRDSGTCGDSITWTVYDDGSLAFTGGGEIPDCDYNTPGPWAAYKSGVTSIWIAEGITHIGSCAFYDFGEVEYVSLPDSLECIGEGAFNACSSLPQIDIPSCTTYIENAAFKDCTTLQNFAFPSGTTQISHMMFSGCSALESVDAPSSITQIGSYAFSGCSSLRDFQIPACITSIADDTFSGCGSLCKIDIPNGVQSIGNSAFSGCGMETVDLPASVMSIERYAFASCKNLTQFNVAAGNQYFTSINDALYSKDGTILIQYPNGRQGAYTIPYGVTHISQDAFDSAKYLTDVSIPTSVTQIGESAFYGCESLTSITIPNQVVTIPKFCYCWCTSLETVSIPKSIKSVKAYAFFGCSSLTSVKYQGSDDDRVDIDIDDNNNELTDAEWQYNSTIQYPPEPGTLSIDETFSDAVFRHYIKTNFDKNGDGGLSERELNSVSTIEVPDRNIYSVAGIENFPNLSTLNCAGNYLQSLNVSGNTNLTELDCANNQLSALDVSACKSLTYLSCGGNQISSLYVGNNAYLEYLYCAGNALDNLYTGNNTALLALDCHGCGLTWLDVHNNTNLFWLNCSDNRLKQLVITMNRKLSTLVCQGNDITGLSLYNAPLLLKAIEDGDLDPTNAYYWYTYGEDRLGFDNTVKLNTGSSGKLTIKKDAKKTLYVGEEITVTVKGKKIKSCKSKKSSIASVTSKGKITARKNGTTKITITTTDKKTYVVTIISVDLSMPSAVALEETGTVSMFIGESLVLHGRMTPANAFADLNWTSSDTYYATVQASTVDRLNGVVYGKRAGTITITAKASRGGAKATVKVKVIDPTVPSKVTLSGFDSGKTYVVGDKLQLNAFLSGPKPGVEADSKLSWSQAGVKLNSKGKVDKKKGTAGSATIKPSNDTESATIKLTKAGGVKITAKAKRGGKKGSVTINVKKKTTPSKISFNEGGATGYVPVYIKDRQQLTVRFGRATDRSAVKWTVAEYQMDGLDAGGIFSKPYEPLLTLTDDPNDPCSVIVQSNGASGYAIIVATPSANKKISARIMVEFKDIFN